MDEDIFIGLFGLILTQLRYARRALEDVERSTARYSGGGFAAALQAGPRFGAPPILDGALKVHVVNINDLAGGQNGLGSLFGNLVGGLGGLVGGITGGFLGGLVGGAALPYNLLQLKEIVNGLPEVLRLAALLKEKPGKDEPPTDYAALTGLLRALTQLLPPLTNLVNALGKNLPDLVGPITALFQLFTQPGKTDPAAKQPTTPSPPVDWVRFAEALTPLVKGLTLLVPILVGAFASLVVHLDALQRTITDLLIWALRLVFLLRGAVLVVIYDTLATVARVAAETLKVLSTAILEIMSAVFTAIERALMLAMDLLAMLSKGVSDTLNAVVNWLRTTLFDTLTMLGELPIFAMIINAVNASSALISRLSGTPLPPPVSMPAAGSGGMSPKGTALDLSQTLAPPDKLAALGAEYSATAAKTFGDIKGAVDKLKDALGEIEKRNAALEAGVGKPGDSPLGQALETVKKSSNDLGSALEKARGPATPVEMPAVLKNIADAYQTWLGSGAMNGLLDQITTYFHGTPTAGPDAGKSISGRIVIDAQSAGPLRPTVEIDEIVIELDQPAAPPAAGTSETENPNNASMTLDQFGELWDDLVTDRHHRRLRLIPGII